MSHPARTPTSAARDRASAPPTRPNMRRGSSRRPGRDHDTGAMPQRRRARARRLDGERSSGTGSGSPSMTREHRSDGRARCRRGSRPAGTRGAIVLVDDALGERRRGARPRGRSRPRCAACGRPWRPARARRRRRPCGRASTPRPRGSRTARSSRAAWSGRSAPRPGCPCAARTPRASARALRAASAVSVPVRSVTARRERRHRDQLLREHRRGQRQRASRATASSRERPPIRHARRTRVRRVTQRGPDGSERPRAAPQPRRLGRARSASAGARARRSRPSAAWRSRASFSTVKLRLHLVAEHHRGEVDRELAHRHVVVLHRLDVAVARHGDAVLGALELRLQVAEVLVGLELRVVLGDHQQPRQRAAPCSPCAVWNCLSEAGSDGVDLDLRRPARAPR